MNYRLSNKNSEPYVSLLHSNEIKSKSYNFPIEQPKLVIKNRRIQE